MKDPLEIIAELRRENEELAQRLANAPKYGDWEAEKHLQWRTKAQDLEAKVRELEAQLAQAQAACANMKMVINCFAEAHDCSGQNMIELAKSNDCGKGWLSPDEAKALQAQCEFYRQETHRWKEACNKVDAKSHELSAQCAAMREALHSAKLRVHDGFDESGSHYSDTCELCKQINKALSTTAGQELLSRLERYEEVLKWYADRGYNKAREALNGGKK